MQYIDWLYPENNVFHVTEEYTVLRSNAKEHYRADTVLFVNGIPTLYQTKICSTQTESKKNTTRLKTETSVWIAAILVN